ncbi:MAG TPA: diguanylate cyclase [Sphingomicrobium sp.]|nr:diguanylate cyclase [Sphingomicrobium sp.]
MSDSLIDASDAEALLAEVARLRGEVSRLEQRVETLDRLAHQDTLIEVPNRRGFMRQLERLIDRVTRYGDRAAMLFVDIDGLKMINDTFGHPAGDEALIQVANMLSAGVRKSDCVARLGGDEFGILLERAGEDDAHETAARLVSRIAGSEFCFEGACLPLSVAIGVAVIEPDDSAVAVLARADQAMYEKKAAAA